MPPVWSALAFLAQLTAWYERGPTGATRQLQDNYKTITRQSTRQSTRQFKTWHKMDNWLLGAKEKNIIYYSFLMRQQPNVHFASCFELSCRLSCRLSCNCLVIVLQLSCSPCWASLLSRGQLGREGQSRPDRRHHLFEQAWPWRLVLPGWHGRRP